MTQDKLIRTLSGVIASVFYAVHAINLILHEGWFNTLWFCHLGCLLIGVGIITRISYLYSTGFYWLIPGVPLWIINVVSTGSFISTSFLTHIGGFIIALFALRYIKIKKYSWLIAGVLMLPLGLFTRLLTPSEHNVNLVFRVWSGWEHLFSSHILYLVILFCGALGIFVICELLIRYIQKFKLQQETLQ